jgi:hydrogenase maturation protein HypF
MVRDVARAEALAALSEEERALLSSVERPIVLVTRRRDSGLADEVSPANPMVGILLPYSPLHHLLLARFDRPLVMTSGNVTEEPIVFRNEDAIERLRGFADLYLVHDRDIVTRCDDSVARVIAGAPVVLRRARGYVPHAVQIRRAFRQPILACGAHLKNSFSIGFNDTVYFGPHIGDLENLETFQSFTASIDRMEKFLRLTPRIVAHDLHPDYLSTIYAKTRPGSQRIAVQHHHAHVASAMAEHGLEGPVIGVAYDGTGYGTDGTAWGGEASNAWPRFERSLSPAAKPRFDKYGASRSLSSTTPSKPTPRSRLCIYSTISPRVGSQPCGR